jgi:heat shock protein HslJ
MLIALLLLAACDTPPPANDVAPTGSWRLVELLSASPSIGNARPDDPAKYEMTLANDGSVSLRLDCNRANGRWVWSATGPAEGEIVFTTLAMTRAACPPGSLDTRIAHELDSVRRYEIKGNQLTLPVMTDGGSQVWSRVAQ